MQNLKLQVLWLDNSLGLSVNQKTVDGNIPLTPYYFWPVSEAWEQIRFELDSKPWIPEEERINLLNLVVDVMHQWQQGRMNSEKKIINTESLQQNINVIGLP